MIVADMNQGTATMPQTVEEPVIVNSVRACTSLDARSIALLKNIATELEPNIKEKFGLCSKQFAAKYMLGELIAGKKRITLEAIVEFRETYWEIMLQPRKFMSMRFDWSVDENVVLLYVAKKLFGNNNRSEALRVMIAYYAMKLGVGKLERKAYIMEPVEAKT